MKCVIIGGTGTLGKELIRQLLVSKKFKQISVMSRDELKQQEAKKEFPTVFFTIGDIRDRDAVLNVVKGAHTVFNLAAMKHVDVAESNPSEAIKTNLIGSMVVADACIACGVPYMVFSNTDKAVLPITTYGYTKALAQNYLVHLNKTQSGTKFSIFNWGNIIASRGSVIDAFVKSLINSGSINITDKRMSRFWILIEDAARFMLSNFENAPFATAIIPPIKGAKVLRMAATVANILKIDNYKINMVGLRGTEKLYEVLQSNHSGCLRSDTCEQYDDSELSEMLTDLVEASAAKIGYQIPARKRLKTVSALAGTAL